MLGLVSIPFAGLLSVFFKFIEVAQEIIMILYLRNNLPLNLKNMLDFLKNYQLSFLIPFLFQHKSGNQVSEEKFGQNKLSSLFLDNSSTVILVAFVMPWFCLLLFLGAQKYLICDRFKTFLQRIESIGVFLKYNLIFLLFQNTTQEMTLFLALQLKFMSFSSDFEIMSSLLCVLFLICDILMIFWLRKITYQIILNKCFDLPKEYQSIFQNLNLAKKHALYFPMVIFFKKFCLSFFVVFLYYNVEVLALCLILLSISMYLFIRIVEPFENKYRNMVAEITQILQSCLFGLLFLYYTCRMESTDDTALYIGYLNLLMKKFGRMLRLDCGINNPCIIISL